MRAQSDQSCSVYPIPHYWGAVYLGCVCSKYALPEWHILARNDRSCKCFESYIPCCCPSYAKRNSDCTPVTKEPTTSFDKSCLRSFALVLKKMLEKKTPLSTCGGPIIVKSSREIPFPTLCLPRETGMKI